MRSDDVMGREYGVDFTGLMCLSACKSIDPKIDRAFFPSVRGAD
jgi:hypothetical protein